MERERRAGEREGRAGERERRCLGRGSDAGWGEGATGRGAGVTLAKAESDAGLGEGTTGRGEGATQAGGREASGIHKYSGLDQHTVSVN